MSDESGRDRLFRNVMAGYWAYGVTVIVGFLLPRIIYESVGQAALGVWDIAWSLVSYLAHSGLGVSSAVTHYVARARAENAPDDVRQAVSTAWYCQIGLALVAAGGFMGLFATLHWWMPLVEDLPPVKLSYIALFLGLAIVVGLLGAVAQGVLTGCHRGSWNEYLTIGSDISLALAMMGVLLAGWGIVGLAAATLFVRLICEAGRLLLARHACTGFSLKLSDATWAWTRRIFEFSTKTSVGIVQDLLIHQVARLALAASAGPVAVASYSRYATVVRQIVRSVERVTQVVPPMTSGLVGLRREHDVAAFSLRASNAAVMMMLPMIVVFGVLGDALVTVWMGPQFVVPGLSWVFAVMAVLHSDRGVTNQVLSGLNSHGRISLICLGVSLVIAVAALFAFYPLNPLSTGLMVAVSTVFGVTIPHFLIACRRLGISYLSHFRNVYFKPLLSNTIFMASLLYSEASLQSGDYIAAAIAGAGGTIVLGILYWNFAFDERLREAVRRRLNLNWAT